ncbi:MAG TPA: S41 family peptidase [Bacteroidia bacterium]|jgi:carboxyl-terminal processing protease|nr:S41 family peptidase [Bacteroidia bacterium]
MLSQFLKRAKKFRLLLVVLAIGTYAFLSYSFTDNYFEISKSLDIYSTTLKELDLYYVDSINPGELVKTSIDAMLSTLDPYTDYIPESEIEDYRFMTTGEYGGIGAIVQRDSNGIEIAEPYLGSPASKAGLNAGDKIMSIDGISTEGKSTDDVGKLLKGQAGTKVTLMILRPNETSQVEKILTREDIKVGNVPYYGMVSDDIGYIKLTEFTQEAGNNVRDALIELKKNHHLKGVILDLRNNPGGLLNEAIKIVNIFEPKGQLVVNTRGRSKEWNHPDMTNGEPVDTNIRIAVVVNGGSASASEIVTGTVQDLDRGVVIGTRTFGKGLVQQTHPLSYNSQLKFTIAKYYTPSGRCIQALDYSHRSADGTVNKVPDSLKSAFRTRHGRVVYDGGGIAPDINMELPKTSAATINLETQFFIFNYATLYRLNHTSIAAADSFSLSDAEYNKFIEFVKAHNFKYTTKSDVLLKELKETTESEKYDGDLKTSYDKIEKDMDEAKKNDLIKYKAEIKLRLEEEIASRYYYQKGRIQTSLKNDEQVKRGIQVLNNTAVYDSILTTIAASKHPFLNPALKTWPASNQGK